VVNNEPFARLQLRDEFLLGGIAETVDVQLQWCAFAKGYHGGKVAGLFKPPIDVQTTNCSARTSVPPDTMSRSRKRQPFVGICTASTAKPYKRLANRLFRQWERADLQAGRDHRSWKLTNDPRLMAYDGKRYRHGLPQCALRK